MQENVWSHCSHPLFCETGGNIKKEFFSLSWFGYALPITSFQNGIQLYPWYILKRTHSSTTTLANALLSGSLSSGHNDLKWLRILLRADYVWKMESVEFPRASWSFRGPQWTATETNNKTIYSPRSAFKLLFCLRPEWRCNAKVWSFWASIFSHEGGYQKRFFFNGFNKVFQNWGLQCLHSINFPGCSFNPVLGKFNNVFSKLAFIPMTTSPLAKNCKFFTKV